MCAKLVSTGFLTAFITLKAVECSRNKDSLFLETFGGFICDEYTFSICGDACGLIYINIIYTNLKKG